MPDDTTTLNPLPGGQNPIVGAGSSVPPPPADEVPGVQPPPPPKEESKFIITSSSPSNPGRTRIVATILGVILLIGSIATGVYFVQRQQLTSTKAWDCRTYIFNVSRDGIISVQNGSTRDEPLQQALVFINEAQSATFNVPALKAGSAATLGNVATPQGAFTWRIKGTKDCESSGRYEPTAKVLICHVPPGTPEDSQTIEVDKNAWETGHDPHNAHSLDFLIDQNHPCPPLTLTPTSKVTTTPSPTNSPTPSPIPDVGGQCLDIKAYDTSWNLLLGDDLKKLKPGTTIRFTVSGTTSSGSFDKARFTINGAQRPEVGNKKPGSNEFYDEFTIPEGTVNFNVNAQLHHSTLGWF